MNWLIQIESMCQCSEKPDSKKELFSNDHLESRNQFNFDNSNKVGQQVLRFGPRRKYKLWDSPR